MPISKFFVHTATVEQFQGTNGYGQDVFAAAVTVPCFTDDSRKLVRSKTGEEVVSETTLYTSAADGVYFQENSRVTMPTNVNTVDGDPLPPRISRVIKVNINDSGSLGLPDHAEVNLE